MLIDPKIAEKATVETITRLDWWNDRLLTFTTTRPANYSFAAGQYARIGLKDEHGLLWRAYSMVSGPSEDHLEFYGIIVPGGLFTAQLQKASVGSEIWIEKQSYGFMTPDRFSDGDDLWMLATGTGIGPFISMLRDTYVWQHFRHIVLVHCVRQESEFAFRDELENLCRHPPATASARLQIVRSTTREQQTESGPAHLHGRITTLLENGELEERAGLPLAVASSRIMMCGNPDMIEDMRKLLHHRGMRPVRRTLPGQFVTENYW